MKALTTAVYAKSNGTAFSTAVGGRIYKGLAPDATTYPYAVYMVVSGTPDNTFTERLENVLIQFSVYSSAPSSAEVEDAVTALRAVYDDCTFTVTGSTVMSCLWQQTTPTTEEHTTPTGTVNVWAYHVDYQIMRQVG